MNTDDELCMVCGQTRLLHTQHRTKHGFSPSGTADPILLADTHDSTSVTIADYYLGIAGQWCYWESEYADDGVVGGGYPSEEAVRAAVARAALRSGTRMFVEFVERDPPKDLLPPPTDDAPVASRWIWIYRVATDERGAITKHENELHLFPSSVIPAAKRAAPTLDLDPEMRPTCGRDLGERWKIFNTGGGDPVRLATITGNSNVEHCTACQEIDRGRK